MEYVDIHGWTRSVSVNTWEERFGLRLKMARVARGWSQHYLAGLVGVTQQTLSGWESGDHLPALPLVAAMCTLLHISVDDLVK